MVPLEQVLDLIIGTESAEVGISESGDIYFLCDDFDIADILTLEHHRTLLQQFVGAFLYSRSQQAKGTSAYNKLRAMPYDSYLRTKHWQQMRETMLHLAGSQCQICNSKKRPQVHHRTYERLGCERLADLIVLCSSCHAKFHNKLPR